ncbi:MAG: aminopeptidase P family protein [Verrucomicrobiae bacterium]|nr:aminopeptidase P family protein [Verrucomicrobiae bacterium]
MILNESPQLTVEGCRARQQRLREKMNALGIERALVVTPEHVQYLTGFRPHWLMHAAALVDLEGDCVLVAPNAEPDFHAADRVEPFEAQWNATLRQEQREAIAEVLHRLEDERPVSRWGGEFTACFHHAKTAMGGEPVADLDPVLWEMRRIKDADEIGMIQKAIDCTDAMYRRAKEIIQPGITELEVFNRLHAAAVREAGEALTGLGNDFQCNSPGGPARAGMVTADGELYILDLGPGYRGYYADNCRAFAVNGQPTDGQLKAWNAIVSIFDIVDEMVKPGASCRELYDRCKARLDEADPTGSFWHHLGHGIGLYPHEAPHLNPAWDDVFQEGEIFTVEPGLYYDGLKAGIRIEENYLVTADGVKQLTVTPRELA